MEEFGILFNDISKLRELHKDKGDFNVLHSIGFSSQETMHSKFISTLLDPKAQHNRQENLFLNLFIKHTKLDFNIDNVKITAEKPAKKRRMDITIENKTNNSILVIENKIWAQDQKRQLADYYDHCNEVYTKVVLVYLTPCGNRPSEYSLSKTLTIDKVNCISYEKTIIPWIEECIVLANGNGRLKSSLVMYNEILHKLINKDKYMNEIFNYLTKDKDKLKLAIDISSALQRRNFIEVYPKTLEFFRQRFFDVSDGVEFDLEPWGKDQCLTVNKDSLDLVGWQIAFEEESVYAVKNQNQINLFYPNDINDSSLQSLIFEEKENADDWILKLFEEMRRLS